MSRSVYEEKLNSLRDVHGKVYYRIQILFCVKVVFSILRFRMSKVGFYLKTTATLNTLRQGLFTCKGQNIFREKHVIYAHQQYIKCDYAMIMDKKGTRRSNQMSVSICN